MYLCICNAVTERDIASLIEQGVTSLGELRSRLRVADGCGGCRDDAEQYLRRHACCRGTNAAAQLIGR